MELSSWLAAHSPSPVRLVESMQGDASFRKYYRVYTDQGSYVAMDASHALPSCPPFIAIDHALGEMGLAVPKIIASDLSQGFLLLSDFGDQTYLKVLNINNADRLYDTALSALSVLQQCHYAAPPFTIDFMMQEWVWHKEWFLQQWLGLELGTLEKVLDQTYALIAQSASAQPQVFMHRDYHAGNLMLLPNDDVGILDFQDAFIGPVTYDLVSLLRDCYIAWPEEYVLDWVMLYWQMLQSTDVLLGVSQQTFLGWFDLMGIQRHLKALMTFSRKSVRDHADHYLQFIPRTLNYILTVSQHYPELAILHDYYLHVVLPAVNKKGNTMRAMILAAGRGMRMGELTLHTPKPLLKVNGKYLIQYVIDELIKANIKEVVINVSYLGDQIQAALGDGFAYGVAIQYSVEAERLETGGGIVKALPLLGDDPFIVLSSDVVTRYPLANLPKQPEGLAHLIMVPNPSYHPKGDFALVDHYLKLDAEPRLTFGNVSVLRKELFLGYKADVFPLSKALKPAIANQQVTGEIYHGFWQNVGTQEDLLKIGEVI